MKKLLKLKEWLTVKEAARYLSAAAEEVITEADILQLSLDGHLTLSVNFVNHSLGRPLRIGTLNDQTEVSQLAEDYLSMHHNPDVPGDEYKIDLTDFLRKPRGVLLPNGKDILIFEGDIQKPEELEGIWDLLMLGTEALDVTHAYQKLNGGPSVDLVCLDGPLVSSHDRTRMYQLLDSFVRENEPSKSEQLPKVKRKVSKETREALDRLYAILGPGPSVDPNKPSLKKWSSERIYYPAGGLPEDSTFVVRTAALRELESKLLAVEVPPEKPLHPSERRSVDRIVAVLAAMAKVDLSAPYKADEAMRHFAASKGLELPSSSETVVKFLKSATKQT